MIAALGSPGAPETASDADAMEMSTDDMIREMFSMMRMMHSSQETQAPVAAVPDVYGSY
jgi:hypothetical protein